MPENDFILLTRKDFARFQALATASALADCTSVREAPHGAVVIEKNWPGLSNGEDVLWSTLAALATGSRPTTELFHRLDDENRAIAETAIAAAFGSAA